MEGMFHREVLRFRPMPDLWARGRDEHEIKIAA